MSWMFKPAGALMGRLPYLYKFTLIGTVFLIPIVMLTVLLFAELDEDIRFMEREQRGVEYIGPLRQLLEHIPQHRGMTNAYLNGNPDFRDRILGKRDTVDRYFSDLEAMDGRLGTILQTGNMVRSLKDRWEALKTRSFDMPAGEAFAEHSHLISEVVALIRHVADHSDLIRTPYLDSYYLVDALVNRLPPLTDVMGQARGLGAGIAASGGRLAGDKKIRLAVLMDQARRDRTELKDSLRRAVVENTDIGVQLEGADESSIDEMQKFFTLLSTGLMEPENIRIKADRVFASGTQAIGAAFRLFDASLSTLENILATRVASANATEQRAITTMTLLLLLALWLFGGFYASTIQSIRTINTATRKFAEGDLRIRLELPVRDEMVRIGENFNNMAEQFGQLIKQIASSSQQLASSSEELSAITVQTSQNVDQQQIQTEQVATAMNEMSATVQEVSRSISGTAQAAQEADAETTEGHKMVDEAIQAIQKLAAQIEGATDVIHKLEKDSEDITSVMDVIRGVAEQTNLLALNAAIEAARAGEQGRGFAVVADEVRTLAGRTQESTEEINQMVERLQAGSREAVDVMNRSRQEAQSVVDQATRAGTLLGSISEAVQRINNMSAQIASAAEEQSATAEEINRNITNISEMSAETSTGAQQTATASGNLAHLGTKLQERVGRFKI